MNNVISKVIVTIRYTQFDFDNVNDAYLFAKIAAEKCENPNEYISINVSFVAVDEKEEKE